MDDGRRRRFDPVGTRHPRDEPAGLPLQGRIAARRDRGLLAARAVPAGERSSGAERPGFQQPLEMTIDGGRPGRLCGTPTITASRRSKTSECELPADLANGIILTLLKNMPAGAPSDERCRWSPRRRSRGSSSSRSRRRARSASRRAASRTSDALHGEGRDRRPRRAGGAARRQAAAGLARVDSRRRGARVREVGRTVVSGGPIWRIELVSPAWPEGTTRTQAASTRGRPAPRSPRR